MSNTRRHRSALLILLLLACWQLSGHAVVHAAPNITVAGRVQAVAVKPGQKQTLTAVILSNLAVSAVIVDFEVYDSMGVQVYHGAQKVALQANKPVRVSKSFTMRRKAFGGLYTFKIGVFTSNYKHLYIWNDNASTFRVRATARPHISATGQIVPNQITPGARVTFRARVSVSGQSLSGAIVDVEVHRGAVRVFQKFTMGFNVPRNGTRVYSVRWTVPWTEPKGLYVLKIGVFNSHWTILYWNDAAATVA